MRSRSLLLYWPVVLVLLLSAGATAVYCRVTVEADRREHRQAFLGESAVVAAEVRMTLEKYDAVLHGLRGLFDASHEVDPQEFDRFARRHRFADAFPGLRLLAYLEPADRSPGAAAAVRFLMPLDESAFGHSAAGWAELQDAMRDSERTGRMVVARSIAPDPGSGEA